MVSLVKHDLEFILKQIEIAEAHAAGGDLATLVAGYHGNDGLAQAHLLPYGLRTVDGSYNNLLPGRENWGAADQSFPGIFTPTYMNDADGDRHDFNPMPTGPGSDGVMGTADDTGVSWYTNNDYANAGPRTGSQPGPGSGTVIDADPRIISNLIVDQTLDNPAAIAAALTHAGMTGQPLMVALSDIVDVHKAAKVLAPIGGAEPSAEYTAAKATLDAKLAQYGVEMDGNTVYLPNVAPDEGLSSPFNGWMTIFGQFFDHGLDLVAKGGNGTVYVPLAPDDPLYSTAPGAQNYIPLTRVTVDAGADGVLGTNDDGPGPKNLTTPWVDQNQTYASTASKQVFMREYTPGPDGKPVATGHLLEGSNGGLATWADIKAQAKNVLGIELTDLNVGNIPLIASDAYGNFIPGQNGYPQLVVGMGPDGKLGTADDVLREGNPAAPVSAQGVVLTGHAFLDDIAHAAVPIVTGGVLQQDTDNALGYANADGSNGPQGQRGPTAYDNELLDRHFIAGDGRANENIALTAVHQVFHSEHNRIVEHTKDVALQSMDRAFINEWLLTDLTDAQFTTLTSGDAAAIAALSKALNWDGERLFQVGRFTNEMEYQHLVFEEFGRMMQPDIDAFVFEPSADINPSIAAEFAHVVYRFGHSMLRQDIDIIKMVDGKPVVADVKLFDGFLNPVMYDSLGDAEAASGAIIRGMTRQIGSEIDEFVTDVLRNQLLGIPLDLATINLARGRDVGTPPLNAAREKFFAETGDTLLKPYTSWADFALNLKNPASIINFIAAYGTHESLINTQANPKTIEQLREAATLLVLGGDGAPDDRLDFLNATGAYAGGTLGGLNTVDFWIGGLAEKKMAFGGMLGSTFAFVFQMTMENLQDADRFYYLSRTQGLNLLNELENNTFAELVMRNTDLGDPDSTALPGNVFSGFEMPILEMDPSKQLDADPVSDNPFLPFAEVVERRDAAGNLIADDDKTTVASYIRVNSNEHFVIGGTENNDVIVSGGGDDAIWGKGGDDKIEAGYGVDKVFGGEGDDIITNAGTDIGEADFLHGNEGNDVIHGGSGLSLIFGNQGNDFIITGPDGKEAFAGTGNDFVLGGSGGDVLLGNEGDDWLEGGQRFDSLSGENSELFFNSTIIGHDVMNGGSGDTDYDGESGDDIMFQNAEGIQRSNGMAGFDWAIHKGDSQAANSDLGIPIFETQEAFILRDRFDLVEGLSGWKHNDVLTGRITGVNTRAELEGTAAIPGLHSPLDSYSNDLLAKNVALITGLAPLVAHLGAGIPVTKVVNGLTVPVLDENGVQERIIFSTADASDILLGGGGSDVITGLAGNDIIDGDNWLNVRIRFVEEGVAYTADEMKGLVYLETDYVNGVPKENAVSQFDGRSLDELMFDRTVNPGQLEIVREIVDGDVANTSTDVAVYRDVVENYTFTRNADGSITVAHTPPADVDPVDPNNPPDDAEEGENGGGEPATLSDGVDRLFSIERLRFSNGNGGTIEYDINQLINVPATGAPVISDLTPTEGQALTVDTSGIQDENGIPTNAAFAYQWQALVGGTTWTDIAGATAATFTPQDLALTAFGAQAGLQLRVVVSFEDARGNPESVTSASTGPVGVNWDGFLGQAFNGTAGDDIADGGGLGEVFTGGGGNDRIDGGSNLLSNDVANYAGGAGEYDFSLNASGQLNVADRDGGEGTDTLTAIEQLRFNGSTFTLVNGSNTGQTLAGGTGTRTDILLGHGGNDTLNANGGADVLVGGSGNDTVNGGDGNDLIIQVGATDGRDIVNGGNNVDTYQVNGLAGAETFTIYSRTAAQAAIPGLTLAVGTEIVIARDGAVIAELDNIEEIRVNTLQVTSPAGSGGGTSSGDTIQVVGDFNGTSLLFSTITIDGNSGNDTIDITSLQSAHRVVFRSNGGNDTIVGTLRAQDVIELAPGTEIRDYEEIVNANGTTTLRSATHSVTYVSDGNPIIKEYEEEDEEHEDEGGNEEPTHNKRPVVTDDRFTVKKGEVLTLTAAQLLANDLDGGTLSIIELDEDEHGTAVLNSDGTITFTPKVGFTGEASFTYMVSDGQGGTTEGKVSIVVEKPAPMAVTGGRGNDRLNGGDSNDQIKGGDGHDRLDGGAGADRMWGGRGNDTYTVDDRSDRVHESRNGGTDTVKANVSYSLVGTHVEKLVLTGSADLNGTGNSLSNSLTGNSGDNVLKGAAGHDSLKGMGGHDRLEGGSGNDKLDAGSGDDKLEGGSGRDRLYGGKGDDRLEGGAGDDRMTGGSGEDIFVFQKGGGRDVVTDFRYGRDEIDVSRLAGVNSLSDLYLNQSGEDAVIAHGSDILVLKGVNASDLDNGDFNF